MAVNGERELVHETDLLNAWHPCHLPMQLCAVPAGLYLNPDIGGLGAEHLEEGRFISGNIIIQYDREEGGKGNRSNNADHHQVLAAAGNDRFAGKQNLKPSSCLMQRKRIALEAMGRDPSPQCSNRLKSVYPAGGG
ncbi:hypothetical protein D3C75_902980 [compost metagenome]